MAKGIKCTGTLNAVKIQSFSSPEALIAIFLISLFPLGSFMIIRKCIKMKQIRAEIPEALRVNIQKPTNDQFGTKSLNVS